MEGTTFTDPYPFFPDPSHGFPSGERPPYIDQLRAESRGLVYRPAARKKPKQTLPDSHTAKLVFTVESGNRWMELGEREPAAKMLFGEFWHQGELCILFADTNVGKTVLAVQIANNIARAKPTGPFACGAKAQKVLYVDFELSTIQFYQRYSHPKGDYDFPANFFRARFNPENAVTGGAGYSYDDLLIAGLEYKIRQVGATVLVIDNISCLRGGTESAAVALRLMNSLKSLKADCKLSILVLAHTPKRRNPARPLAADDLHGSKLLINFADSAFAIGKSTTDAGLCYIKQIKQRNTKQLYGEDNVALCRISKAPLSAKKPGNFLHFDFEGYDAERPHIRIPEKHGYNRSYVDRQLLAAQVAALAAEGLSQQQIALQLNIAKGTVNKLLHPGDWQKEDDIAPADGTHAPTASPVDDASPLRTDKIPPRLRHEIGTGELYLGASHAQGHAASVTGARANDPP